MREQKNRVEVEGNNLQFPLSWRIQVTKINRDLLGRTFLLCLHLIPVVRICIVLLPSAGITSGLFCWD